MLTRKSIITALLLIFILSVSVGCKLNPSKMIVGTWETSPMGLTWQMTFQSNGDFSSVVLGESTTGTYSVRGNNLSFTVNGETDTISIEFTNNETFLLDIDGEFATFKRIR
jgi:hypothetical protein